MLREGLIGRLGNFMARRLDPRITRTGGVAAVEAPTVTWARAGETSDMVCPNCGEAGTKPRLLTVHFRSPDRPAMCHWAVLTCPSCTARFYEHQIVADYADAAMLERGRVPFYIQQGAGVSTITRPLAQVRAPAGSQYLEVGCGFGFGLDYAIRARFWHGRGIDPAGLSALGRDQLALDIELRTLEAEETGIGSYDVVMASEVIEHVPAPRRFLATLRTLLKPGGLLILTTPDGEEIAPRTSPGALVPMLSPRLHLVIQTAASLRWLLEAEGFAHIVLERDGQSLVAFAADAPFTLETDASVLGAAYRAHLVGRAAAMPPGGDVMLGFAGRALLEGANTGDLATADAAWDLLLPACRDRFGIDLASLAHLPAGAAQADLATLSRLMPLNLATILYAAGMRALAGGAARPGLADRFAVAAGAADALRQALGKLAMEDGLTEEIGWVSRMEALICQAVAGVRDVPARLATLPPAPAGAPDERRAIAGRRVFVALVNAGHYDMARQVADREALSRAAFAQQPALANVPLETSERDALFCLAVLDLQAPGDLTFAVRRFSRVVASLAEPGAMPPGPDGLIWAATRGLLSAADQIGDPATSFAGLRQALTACGDDPARLPDDLAALWPGRALDQFVRLVLARDFIAAAELRAVAGLAARADDPSLSQAERWSLWFALASLDAAEGGDPARAAAGFARLHASLPADHPLVWPTVRGAIALPSAPADARALLTAMTQGVPRDDIPPDLLDRIDGGQ